MDDHRPSNDVTDECPLRGHVIIAGFGIPGRAAADLLTSLDRDYCVIELNPETVRRCSRGGVPIIAGDASEERTLRRAGIEHATLLAVTIPSDPSVLEVVRQARQLNSGIHIMARCRFISAGMEAHRRGANEVVVEEQAVAREFTRLIENDAIRRAPLRK